MITELNEKAIGVEVPSGAYDFDINGSELFFINKHKDDPYPLGLDDVDGRDLPSGVWQILGRGSELTEEQWKQGSLNWIEIVDEVGYRDYTRYEDFRYFKTATESGLSLLKSKNLNPDNALILIKKP